MSRRTASRHNQGAVPPPAKVRGINVQEGESVLLVARPALAAVWPKYLLTLGAYGIWRRRNTSVLTDRRVLIGKGFISRTEHSIPLNRINDAVYQRKGLFAYVEIASVRRGRPAVQRLGPLSTRQARQLTDQILSRT